VHESTSAHIKLPPILSCPGCPTSLRGESLSVSDDQVEPLDLTKWHPSGSSDVYQHKMSRTRIHMMHSTVCEAQDCDVMHSTRCYAPVRGCSAEHRDSQKQGDKLWGLWTSSSYTQIFYSCVPNKNRDVIWDGSHRRGHAVVFSPDSWNVVTTAQATTRTAGSCTQPRPPTHVHKRPHTRETQAAGSDHA
jgi:hypothetical protein